MRDGGDGFEIWDAVREGMGIWAKVLGDGDGAGAGAGVRCVTMVFLGVVGIGDGRRRMDGCHGGREGVGACNGVRFARPVAWLVASGSPAGMG